MFRFQVLLPIVALFLLWRSLKFVAGWVAGSVAVLSISATITGVNAQTRYVRLLRQMGSVSSVRPLRRRMRQFALYSWLAILGWFRWRWYPFSIFLVAVVSARQDAQQRLLLAVSVSALATYYLFLHDLSVLALPLSPGNQRGHWPGRLVARGPGFHRAVGLRGVLVYSG
jgi:hypothetical protein